MLYNFKIVIFIIFFLLLSCKSTKKEKSFKNFAIVSAKVEASKAGHKILKMGGNAFDAMIATDLALAVVYPNAGNLGGGGFMVYRQKNGENGSLDFREKAPINAYENMYLNDENNVVKNSSNEGALSIGIPGTIAGLFEVYKKFGTLPIDSLFEPALSLAKNGFPLTNKQAKLFNLNKNKILKNSDSINLFNKDFKTNMIFKNIPLYNTLKYILKNGKDGFYKGKISD